MGSKGTVSLNSMNGFEERATENCDDGSCMMSGELSSLREGEYGAFEEFITFVAQSLLNFLIEYFLYFFFG